MLDWSLVLNGAEENPSRTCAPQKQKKPPRDHRDGFLMFRCEAQKRPRNI
jgi:hypothetical protein